MAMTPTEMLAFCVEQAELAQSHLGAPGMFEFNAQQAANQYLMAALITWRHKLGDPRISLRLFHRFTSEVVDRLRNSDSPIPPHQRFRFYDLIFVSALLKEPYPEAVGPLIQMGTRSGGVDPGFDFALAESIVGDRQVLQDAILSRVPSKRQRLFYSTYNAYARILDGSLDAVQEAEQHFYRRAKDGYHSGGIGVDGGGPDNEHTVDYRLGAVLAAVGFEGQSLHTLPD